MKRMIPLTILAVVLLAVTGCPGKTSAYRVFWQMLDASTKQVIIQKGDIVADQMVLGHWGAQAAFIPGSGQAGYAAAIQLSLANNEGANSPVSASWAYDATAFDIQDGIGAYLYQKIFIPKKTGRFIVTATADGTVLRIPINVYPAIGLNADSKWGATTGLIFGTSTATGSTAESAELYVNTSSGAITAKNGIGGVDVNSLNPYEPLMHQLLNSGSQPGASETLAHNVLMNYDAYILRAANGLTVKLRFYNMTGDPAGQAKLIYLVANANDHFDY